MERMGKHEEKEGGRQYIRSILTLTVIFNSAPRFAKWAEFLCSPRTYSFQIGYMYFPLGFQIFICSSSVTAASNLRGRIMMHTAVKTFIHNTDSSVIFASRWTLGQLFSLCIPWQRSGVSSPALSKVKMLNLTHGTHFKISRLQQTIWWWKLLVIHSPECARLGVTAVKSVLFCIYLTKKFSTYRD